MIGLLFATFSSAQAGQRAGSDADAATLGPTQSGLVVVELDVAATEMQYVLKSAAAAFVPKPPGRVRSTD